MKIASSGCCPPRNDKKPCVPRQACSHGAGRLLFTLRVLLPSLNPQDLGRGWGWGRNMPDHSPIMNGCLDREGARPQGNSGRTAEERGDYNNTKPVVPVPVVWVVPVAVGATRVVGFIVEGTTAKSKGISLAIATSGFDTPQSASARLLNQRRPYECVTFFQPPSSRPISAIISATCLYCPAVSHSQRAARRR